MSPEPSVSPPRLAEALLAWRLPDDGISESVLGDLHELFVERASGPRGGVWRARIWYWMQALRVSTRHTGRQLAGRSRSGRLPVPQPSSARTGSQGEEVKGLVRQLRLTGRSLMRNPGFTLPAVLILAIGMTAMTVTFTLADSVLFRPLDLPASHRIVIVCEDHPQLRGACLASPTNTEDLRTSTATVEDLGIGRGWSFHLTDREGSRGVRGGLATAGFLRALGAQADVGRIFRDEEIGPDNDKVVLLSHAFWSARYGRDTEIPGSTIHLEGEPFTVVGVLPPGFEVPFDLGGIQIWKPPHFDPADSEHRGWRGFRTIGRLAEGASAAAAEAELANIYAGLAAEHEEIDERWRLRVDPLLNVVVGSTRPILLAFLGGAGVLLLIVCANVANLLLARGLEQRHELAIRAAIGASRRRLVGQTLGESIVVAGVATIAALVLSGGATRVLVALAPSDIPRLGDVAVDGRVMTFAAIAGMLATVVFGLLPGFQVTSWNLGQTLRSGARDGERRSSRRLRSGLVMAEVALSVVLVSSAVMLTRSFSRYLDWDPGFERDPLLAVSIFVDIGKYPDRDDYMSVIKRTEERVAALPGVTAAATTSAGPLFGGGDGATPFALESDDRSGQLPSAWWFEVGPRYFGTLGLPIVQGRELTEADVAEAPAVAVVNETLAGMAWPGTDAVGRVLYLPELELSLQVVGVVSDVPPLTPGEAPRAEVYWSNRQFGRPAPYLIMRTRGDPSSQAIPVVEAITEVDPNTSVGTPRSLTSSEQAALARPRFQALVLLAIAGAALVLSSVGVYAVVSYSAARRVREMGIRMALGAGSASVVGTVIGSALRVTGLGAAMGLVGALWAGHVIRGMIPGISPTDPMSLGGAVLLLVLSALAAASAPALRAGRTNPLTAIVHG